MTTQHEQSVILAPRMVHLGEFAGWQTWTGADPYESITGPFYFRELVEGQVECAFRAEHRHLNGAGAVHGGCFMTFADFCCFAIAWRALEGRSAVTVALEGDFLAAGREGDLITARGEILRAGAALIFVRGIIAASGRQALSFSGILKRF